MARSTKSTNQAKELHPLVQEKMEFLGQFSNIPAFIRKQALEGYEQFYIDSELFPFLRVVIEDPKLYGEGVSVVIRISGIMGEEDKELVMPVRGQTELSPGTCRMNGFRSNPILILPKHVEAGLLTETQFEGLINYAKEWAGIIEEYGPRAAYENKNYTRFRSYLMAKSNESYLVFNIVARNNPNTGELVPGIENLCWMNLNFIGAGQSQEPAQALKLDSNFKPRKVNSEIPY
jgi:hypothetical protein